MKKPYVVQANAPTRYFSVGWDYPTGYFPRKVHYLKEAKKLADEAVRKGANSVCIRYPNGKALYMWPVR